MKKELCVRLVIYKDCTEMHGQQNIKFNNTVSDHNSCHHEGTTTNLTTMAAVTYLKTFEYLYYIGIRTSLMNVSTSAIILLGVWV
jgi:hypothetical protein